MVHLRDITLGQGLLSVFQDRRQEPSCLDSLKSLSAHLGSSSSRGDHLSPHENSPEGRKQGIEQDRLFPGHNPRSLGPVAVSFQASETSLKCTNQTFGSKAQTVHSQHENLNVMAFNIRISVSP